MAMVSDSGVPVPRDVHVLEVLRRCDGCPLFSAETARHHIAHWTRLLAPTCTGPAMASISYTPDAALERVYEATRTSLQQRGVAARKGYLLHGTR